MPLAEDVDLGAVAASTPGMVGADLANLAKTARRVDAAGREEIGQRGQARGDGIGVTGGEAQAPAAFEHLIEGYLAAGGDDQGRGVSLQTIGLQGAGEDLAPGPPVGLERRPPEEKSDVGLLGPHRLGELPGIRGKDRCHHQAGAALHVGEDGPPEGTGVAIPGP